jgi:uncharacterized membrane protein
MFIPTKNFTKEQGKVKVTKDRPVKSIVKAITWRIVGTLDTITISYFLTGEIGKALSIGGIEVFSKMILYYFHERAWAQLNWGRMLVVIRRNTRWSRRSVERIILKRA